MMTYIRFSISKIIQVKNIFQNKQIGFTCSEYVPSKPPAFHQQWPTNQHTSCHHLYLLSIQQSYTNTSREIPGSTFYELCELLRKVGPGQTSANPIPWQGTPKLVPWRVHDPYPPPSGGVLTQAADWTVAARKVARGGKFFMGEEWWQVESSFVASIRCSSNDERIEGLFLMVAYGQRHATHFPKKNGTATDGAFFRNDSQWRLKASSSPCFSRSFFLVFSLLVLFMTSSVQKLAVHLKLRLPLNAACTDALNASQKSILKISRTVLLCKAMHIFTFKMILHVEPPAAQG